MYKPHHSWRYHLRQSPEELLDALQDIPIPEYQASELDEEIAEGIAEDVMNGPGCCIVRGAYSKQSMDDFNAWCEEVRTEAMMDQNSIHPIQSGKTLINDVVTRLSSSQPNLFLDIFNNNSLTTVGDALLGLMCFGSATAHWINPGGNRQDSHVDYPLHFHSSPVWNSNMEKLQRLVTREQVQDVLSHHSVQILVACDKMNQQNGSTQVVPSSQSLDLIDIHIQDPNIKAAFDASNKFVNVDLEQGDMLIFARNIVHRGGANMSKSRRNALIFQCVHLFAVPQEIYKADEATMEMAKKNMSPEEFEVFEYRFKQPFPKNVKMST